jgi:outer membrane protein OmpA-like peptidoglycan-associated protein
LQYYGSVVKDTAVKADRNERQRYASLLMTAGRYEDARVILNGTDSLDASGKTLLSSCDSIGAWQQDSMQYLVEHSKINTGTESNFSPLYYKDGILFVSDRGKLTNWNRYDWTGRTYLDVYYAKSDTAAPQKFSGEINGIYHDGPVAINAAGDTLYLTRNNYVKKKVGKTTQDVVNFKLYQMYRKDTVWTGLTELPFSTGDHNTGHPALSFDGNTIYFASDRAGGMGGSDIWFSRKLNGVWGDPVNLGPEVNTAGNEVFPSVYKDSLFFYSTDGACGMGGLDIYRAKMMEGQIGKPVNVGYPFNSSFDDFGVAISRDGNEGYFSSNRDNSDSELDHLYHVFFQDIRFTLQGMAVNKVTQEPVEDVLVELRNLTTGRVDTAVSWLDGTFKFKLDPNTDYSVAGTRDGYFTNSEEVSTVGKRQSENMFVSLKLELEEIVVNKPIVLENIYYDLNKWEIRADASQGLDKLVQILKENPNISIELGSHTDSRADDKYNMDLSQKRADAAVAYIVAHGIAKERITAVGYGESQLVNQCDNGVICTEEEHQANRRTEFKVVRIDKKL